MFIVYNTTTLLRMPWVHMFYLDAPHPTQIPITTSGTVIRSETLGAGVPGQADSGSARQALVGAHWIQADSEVALPPKVAGSPGTEQSRRGGEGRADHNHSSTGGGGGLEQLFSRGISRVYGDTT